MTCANQRFTQSRCGGLMADGYAHHPYDFDHKPTLQVPGRDNVDDQHARPPDARRSTACAAAGGLTHAGGGALDLYLTEYGYFRVGQAAGVRVASAAKYLSQAFADRPAQPAGASRCSSTCSPSRRRSTASSTPASSRRADRVVEAFKALAAAGRSGARTRRDRALGRRRRRRMAAQPVEPAPADAASRTAGRRRRWRRQLHPRPPPDRRRRRNRRRTTSTVRLPPPLNRLPAGARAVVLRRRSRADQPSYALASASVAEKRGVQGRRAEGGLRPSSARGRRNATLCRRPASRRPGRRPRPAARPGRRGRSSATGSERSRRAGCR